MNIKAQCCGLILIAILFFFYMRQRKMMLSTGAAFYRFFFAAFLCLFLDAFSIVGITYMDIWPIILVKFICKSYLVSLLAVSLFAFLYASIDVYTPSNPIYKRLHNIFYGIGLLGLILIYVCPIMIHRGSNSDDVYTYGASVITTYIFCIFFLISNFYLIFRKKGQMNPYRREAMLFWMLLWMGSSAIQFFNNQLLLVGYAGALGLTILYLKLENPEVYMDRRSGLFNQNGFLEYLKSLYNKKTSVTMVGIKPLYIADGGMNRSIPPHIQNEIAIYLCNLKDLTAFQYAENEYILILENTEQADHILDQLTERFKHGWGGNENDIVKVTFGFVPDSMIVERPDIFMDILRYSKLKAVKGSSNRAFVVNDVILEEYQKEKRTEQLILHAIENDRVEVFYQPIFSTKEKKFTSAEALVRIVGENGKIISPAVFIPIAEENGTILRLGEIVFEKVCRFLSEHNPSDIGLHYIEVNLSVVQCAYENLARDYIAIMEKYRISPDWINLEITESASLAAKQILLGNMKELMDYGVSFSLDDFGTGQSNLNYIIDMPVDIVKFDRQMTVAYFEDTKAKYIMDAAMHMIQGLKLAIVSEGIEEAEQYETMERLGIDYIQGFYFSKPLPEEEYLKFMQQRAGT